MGHWRYRLTVAIATLGAAVIAFWVFLRFQRAEWQSAEYPALITWTIPLALLVAFVATRLHVLLGARGVVLRIAVGVVMALVIAIAWTYAAVFLTGGYALAFDANPLWCWAVGSVAGSLTGMLWPLRGRHRGLEPKAAA